MEATPDQSGHQMDVNYQPMTFPALRAYLSKGLSTKEKLLHSQAMAHILGMQKAPYILHEVDAQLANAAAHAMDIEWFESGPKTITEIGVASLSLPQPLTAKPIQKLTDMTVHHMRVKEHAHMVNGEKCAGHPEKFEFGSTSFVSVAEARQALTDMFVQYDANNMLRPIILIGHAVDNDIDILREKFDFDLEAMGVVVMVLDTQVMAQELGIEYGRKMSLKGILAQYSIQEQYLHNAGNDIGQTMVAATLLAGERATGRGRYSADNQADVDNLKSLLRNRSSLIWGVPTFCTNCNDTTHMVGQCPKKFWCTRCAAIPKYLARASTHPIEKCVVPPFPCQACIESPNKYRNRFAKPHYIEDCGYLQPLEALPTWEDGNTFRTRHFTYAITYLWTPDPFELPSNECAQGYCQSF